jgi:diacylglycerol kinase (ATP)
MRLSELPVLRIFARWFHSASYAIDGILHAARHQMHIKFHMLAAFAILLFCFVIGIDRYEFIAITMVTILVITAEMFNSSLEAIVDMKTPEKNESARIAKDIAAGAVLISVVGALIVGYLVLWPYLIRLVAEGFWVSRHEPENIAVLSFIIVMLLVILIKTYLGKGSSLRGGFPSGHAAFFFSASVSVIHLEAGRLIVGAVFLLALAVSLSRVWQKIHSLLDVLAGAALGSLVTQLLFWIFL